MLRAFGSGSSRWSWTEPERPDTSVARASAPRPRPSPWTLTPWRDPTSSRNTDNRLPPHPKSRSQLASAYLRDPPERPIMLATYSRHIVVRAQAEPPLEPEHGRQRGGDEQTVGEIPGHERPHRAHREMRLQHPAVHRIGRARDDAQRIAPVPERRAFESIAKIAAPDPTAKRSFGIMITRGC